MKTIYLQDYKKIRLTKPPKRTPARRMGSCWTFTASWFYYDYTMDSTFSLSDKQLSCSVDVFTFRPKKVHAGFVDTVFSILLIPLSNRISETAAKVRQMDETLPINLCTGYSSMPANDDIQTVNEILRKPVPREQLLDAINRNLPRQHIGM